MDTCSNKLLLVEEKRRRANVSPRFASDCSSRVLARARNKTTRRRAKPMEENIVDVLLYSSVSFALFEEQEPSLSAFTISPDDYSILPSFLSFICLLSVRRISLANRAPPLYSHPRELCIDRATRKSNSTKCILTAVVDPNCAIDIVSVACVIKSEDFDCLLVVLFFVRRLCAFFRPETQRSFAVSKREKYHPKRDVVKKPSGEEKMQKKTPSRTSSSFFGLFCLRQHLFFNFIFTTFLTPPVSALCGGTRRRRRKNHKVFIYIRTYVLLKRQSLLRNKEEHHYETLIWSKKDHRSAFVGGHDE